MDREQFIKVMTEARVFDLTQALSIFTPPWPGEKALEVHFFKRLTGAYGGGQGANGQIIEWSNNTSTHLVGERAFHSGARAIAELERQVRQIVAGEPVTREVYPHQIAFNVLPHVDTFLPGGYTREEMKMENEARKIMHHPTFRASVTCVRVPVYRAHSVAVSAEFERPVTVEAAREVLRRAPGLDVVDDPARCEYPLPLYQAGRDNCAVGRLRKDCALDNGLCFWVSGDQLLKGAALNAVQIAEELLQL